VVKMNSEELATAVLTLLRSPELRKTMGKAVLERAQQNFRLDQQVDRVEEFYQRLITLGKWRKR
jgi:glycosyltransferase involved in cell wall biosynthesis